MKSVVVILAIIIIGGGVWFYLNLNKNDSKIMDNLSNQEPKPTTQNNSQPIPSSDKTGSGSFKFSCSQIASAEEVSKIFSNNFAQELDIKLTSGDGIACGYRGSDFLGVSFIIGDVFPQPADSVVDISKDLFKVHGVAVENINIGTNGFYVTEDKETPYHKALFFADSSNRLSVTIQINEKFTREQLISFARLINSNLNK